MHALTIPKSLQSQQRIPQRTPHQRAARSDRLRRPHSLQARIDLHQIHSHETSSPMHALGDIIALTEGQAPAYGRAGAGGPLRVEGVDVEGEVDGGVGADVAEGHFHHATNPIPSTCQSRKPIPNLHCSEHTCQYHAY